jgi:class 3 adenylate cyclase
MPCSTNRVVPDRRSPRPRPGRALLTLLFTDIVGSTARAAELGDQRWHGLL